MTTNKMKVTREGNRMIIEGIPAMLYINEEGHGSGQLFDNGTSVVGLQKVTIEASTDTFTEQTLKLVVSVKL